MSKPNAGNESAEMDFCSHFAALRPHLVRGAAAVVVIAVAAFFARHFLIDVVLFGPKSAGFPTNRLLLETGHGLAAQSGSRWYLTPRGWLVSNRIILALQLSLIHI